MFVDKVLDVFNLFYLLRVLFVYVLDTYFVGLLCRIVYLYLMFVIFFIIVIIYLIRAFILDLKLV